MNTYHAILGPGSDEPNHTTIFLNPEESVEEFLKQEQCITLIANVGRVKRGERKCATPSWEHYEAEGYRVVKCQIIVVP